MSEFSIQSIDVDKLFEQHNVGEIDQIHKILQKEIEEKKEEIRIIVGERYRDLLQAADTITEMENTSSKLVDQIKQVSNNCQRLNETQLFGFKTENPQDKKIDKNMELYFTTNIRIRLLTLLPDLVYSYIDSNEYFIAAQINVLSEHIISSLKLEPDNPFPPYFPVQKKIFSLVELVADSLRESVINRLEDDDLDAEAASDCILCLYMIQQTNLDVLLSSFLERRTVAYKRSLVHKDAEKRVKDRILLSLKVLISTVMLANKCFFSNKNEKGLIMVKLDEYRQPDQKPIVNYVDFDNKDWVPFLPPNIKYFRPSLEDPVFEESVVESCCSKWLKLISDISSSELRKLVDLITSMKVIQEFKKEAFDLGNDPQWPNKCHLFQLKSPIEFYKEIYVPLINDRVMKIITQSWEKCIENTFEKIKAKTEDLSKITELTNLWEIDENDFPKSLNHALNQDKKENRLLMKIKGYSSEIVSICKVFDENINEIFSETKGLIDDSNKKGGIFDESLTDFLKNITQSQISDLITKLKMFMKENNAISIVFVAKFLSALTELTPNLKACLTFTNIYGGKDWSTHIGDKRTTEKWTTVCNLIEEESFLMWKKFSDLLFADFLEKNPLNENLSYRTILEDFVNWETILVEEKDEQDNPVSSSIRIPSQPRISIHKFLFKLTKVLNNLVPQNLPTNVLRYLILKLVSYFLEYYNKLIQCKFASTNQNMALQLFFDLKFLQTTFIARDEKKLAEEFQKLLNTLKNFIDPFDFELFHPYLTSNIKKCIFRMQHQLGILLPYPESLNALIGDLRGSTSLLEKDPNVLTLSSSAANATWFPLLPVVMDNKPEPIIETEKIASPTNPSPPPPEIQDDTKQTAQNYAINVKSGAAAFFGAMSQDWFR